MKVELTDKQVHEILDDLSIKDFYTYLEKRPSKGFALFKALILDAYNTESIISAFANIIEDAPIQKELF